MMIRSMLRRAVLAMLLTSMCCAVTGVASAATSEAQPALVIQTLDGKTFNLAAERGKWVIVNFWATWCAPCIEEMPAISKYVATHPKVTAIGLAWDRTPRAEIDAFVKKHPVDYPLAQVDMDHPPASFLRPDKVWFVTVLPTTYLISPDGDVAKRFVGAVNAKSLNAAIASAAQGS